MEYEPLLVGILFPFFEGFVLVKKAGKCDFVNKVGEAIIQPAFNEAGNFSEGLALVNKQSRWGFIISDGQIVIPCSFDHAYAFRRGLARVRQQDTLFYIDPTGWAYVD